MSQLILLNHDFVQRQQLFSTLKWEPLFWLAVVAAGYCGVTLAQRIHPVTRPETQPEKSTNKKKVYVNTTIAFIASVFIAQVSIRLFAQDIKLDSVITQPPTAQIIFAIIVSFGITAFIVKKFLDVSYIWPIIASALITAFVAIVYTDQSTLQILAERWSAVFFHNSVVSILPIQMVVFGTIGSVWGYWLAIQYNWWRKHGS